MKKNVKYIIMILCIAVLLVGQYIYLTGVDPYKAIFCGSNLPSVRVLEDTVLDITEEVKDIKAQSEEDFYVYDNYKFYVDAISSEALPAEKFSAGDWLLVEYSCDSTYVMKPQKDPFILGMKEVMEQAKTSQDKALIEDYINEGINWRKDLYKNPQKNTGRVYVYFEHAKADAYQALEEYEIYYWYQDGTENKLVPLAEYLLPKDVDKVKEQGVAAAKSLLGY